MRIVNEGALYSDRSKLSVDFYLRARSIRGRSVFEEIRYICAQKELSNGNLIVEIDFFTSQATSYAAVSLIRTICPHPLHIEHITILFS